MLHGEGGEPRPKTRIRGRIQIDLGVGDKQRLLADAAPVERSQPGQFPQPLGKLLPPNRLFQQPRHRFGLGARAEFYPAAVLGAAAAAARGPG